MSEEEGLRVADLGSEILVKWTVTPLNHVPGELLLNVGIPLEQLNGPNE